MSDSYILPVYPDRGLTFVSGEGAYLIEKSGGRYLDMMSNYGVSIFGYNHPEITKALTAQIGRVMTLHGSFRSDVREDASRELATRCGSSYARIHWSNSGAEAAEAALKFSVIATGKRKFIVCEEGYHGKTLGALSATASEKYKAPFQPLLWDFVAVPFGDFEAFSKAVDDNTVGFIMEPIQGEGGIFMPPLDYLQKVRALCSEKGILLILDEIQTGCGRTGTFLASEGIEADILCLGKGLACGIPVGATLMTEAVAKNVPKHIHTSTFGGNPLAAAGVRTALRLLDDDMLAKVNRMGALLRDSLAAIRSPLLKEVRGKGLMIGAEVTAGRNAILRLMQERTVLTIPAGENVVRFLPPFVISEEDVARAAKAFESALREVEKNPK